MAYRLTGGTWGMTTKGANGGEEVHDPLVDRFTMAATQLEHILLQSVSGDTRDGVALTDADTNNDAPKGTVPTNEKWELWACTLIYMAIALRTDAQIQLILNMIRQTTMTFLIGPSKKMFKHPLWRYLKGLQVYTAPAVTVESQLLSKPILEMKWNLEIPIILEAGAIPKVLVNHITAPDAALNGDFVGFEFDRRRIMAL